MEQQKVRSDKPGRSTDTLFKVTLRNQVDHIAIADSKANMIININTIIISLVIAILGSGLSIGGINFIEKDLVVYPLTILMITCLISAIYAVLSARPKLNNKQGEEGPGILFFGRISAMDRRSYLDKMKEILSSRGKIEENLLLDMYYQGVILQRKYTLVRNAYTIFILGLSGAVVLFLILWFLQT